MLYLDLTANRFELSSIFEGQSVPNGSGKILSQQQRVQNESYRQRIILLDTYQLLTVSPAPPQSNGIPRAFSADMQFVRPGGRGTVIWFDCKAERRVR